MSGVEIKREHDSVDDFEHLEHDVQDLKGLKSRVEDLSALGEVLDVSAIAQPCPREMEDPKEASLLLVHAETASYSNNFGPETKLINTPETKPETNQKIKTEVRPEVKAEDKIEKEVPQKVGEAILGEKDEAGLESFVDKVEEKEVRESVLPVPEKSPTLDFLGEVGGRRNVDDSWNVVERNDGTSKPLNTSPQDTEVNTGKGEDSPNVFSNENPSKIENLEKLDKFDKLEKLDKLDKFDKLEKLDNAEKMDKLDKLDKLDKNERFEMSNDFVFAEAPRKGQGSETGESEFESEAEASPARTSRTEPEVRSVRATNEEIEIAPKEIFKSMGIDAWFNPERLNPKVAALIYWREPRKSGVVFASILAVLLSLASTSLISVLAYISLLVLTGTVGIRIYKTVLQAVQKTSDGHPFKDALSLDLALPSEKVHQVADVAVAHANAAVSELRRLFLVEDFVDSVKFGVLLWCLTYVGSWFNGLTLIIIGVVALFTLPKVYETNKAQIDQNLALVQGKINELTAKVRAAIPLGKKPEPTKEE